MPKTFKTGDRVEWNSEAGRVRGTIRRKITAPLIFKGYTVRASPEIPQYLIASATTDHLAMHKGSALKLVRGKNPLVQRPRFARKPQEGKTR